MFLFLCFSKVAILLEEENKRRKAAEENARRLEQERQRQQQQQPKLRHETEIANFGYSNSDVVTGPVVALDSITYPDSDNSSPINQKVYLPSAPEPSGNPYTSSPTDRSYSDQGTRFVVFLDL